MHLYIATRGQKDMVDQVIRDMQAQYFPYKISPHDKKPGMIQLGVRPMQFWEIAFPKECYPEVMRSLKPAVLSIKSKGVLRKGLSILFKLKRLLGLKSCPKWDEKGQYRILSPNAKRFVDIKAIGIKEDKDLKTEAI